MVPPETLVPESKTIHLFVVVTKWCVCKRLSIDVHIIQLRHISSYYLISVNEYHLFTKETHDFRFLDEIVYCCFQIVIQ